MLEEVRIRNLGVIADATLPLSPGFTVVTGETGAGKTMVVAGLMLLFGARSDTQAVSRGASSADIEGRLRLSADSPAIARTEEAGGSADDDGTLILSRQVTAEGRSRATAGGRGVPVGVLGELAASLLSVHGQSSQLRLARSQAQRELLDRSVGAALAKRAAAHRAAYERWQALQAELADRQRDDAERQREIAYLRFGLEQIEKAGVQPGEDVAIDEESRRLANADRLRVAVQTARQALDGAGDEFSGGGAGDLLAAAQRALEDVAADDAALGELSGRLRELGVLATDISSELSGYADSLSADPQRLEHLMGRRAELRELTRAYGGADGADGVLAWAQQAAASLESIDGSEAALQQLQAEVHEAQEAVVSSAAALTAARSKAARRLAKEVSAELAELALAGTSLLVQVAPRPVTEGRPQIDVDGTPVGVGASGADEVQFEIASDSGSSQRPLAKGASGGELSRIMLALEVVLAGTDPVATMVFDEVDSGVGGEAAIEIGRRLARLGRDHQVIAVTHLPQVAAYADHHVVIEKDSSGAVTRSAIRALDSEERAGELTRMMAGLSGSDAGRAHAAELLALADGDRAAFGPRGRSR